MLFVTIVIKHVLYFAMEKEHRFRHNLLTDRLSEYGL